MWELDMGIKQYLKGFYSRLLWPVYRQPDFIVGGTEYPYLLRWYVIPRNRWCNIYLHKFLRDDDDKALHDHPWHSLSVVLKGGYFEVLPFQSEELVVLREPGDVILRRAEHSHRIALHRDLSTRNKLVPAWTLFITGPRVRQWGFHCPKGWVHWKHFTDLDDPGKSGRGCA
jgi:hypothetical protein